MYKILEEYPNYHIYPDGRIFGTVSKKFLKHQIKKGYATVCLGLGSRKNNKWLLVHRLVALAFLDNPLSKPQVNHFDGDKLNNDVSNLEWVTVTENNQHAYDIGLKTGFVGTDNPSSKLNEMDVLYIRDNPKGLTKKALAKEMGICYQALFNITNRKTWKHV